MMERLGIISGTIPLREKGVLRNPEEKRIETACGNALVLVGEDIAFIPRHGSEPGGYILPHLINNAANFLALKSLGVREVIGINSTGSLKKNLPPGTLVVPDDFIMLHPGPAVFSTPAAHLTPQLSEEVRRKFLAAVAACGLPAVDGGVYWQTAGPRFETKAEIRFMSQFADLVGMTMAAEAIVARELAMEYAALCPVDNYAHGLVDKELSMAEVLQCARRNGETIAGIVKCYVERRKG
ncbi:MAG: MTAP family purine nucleoside phosphorylase [Syntrophobacterales bacterium]|nr:MTAP family purine nucleoside phosphorylase [Syntrophobacterales bacterium]